MTSCRCQRGWEYEGTLQVSTGSMVSQLQGSSSAPTASRVGAADAPNAAQPHRQRTPFAEGEEDEENMKSTLYITIQGRGGVVQYDGKEENVWLDKKPFLAGVARVAVDPRRIKAIEVRMGSATFSTTRQIVAVVNTLAWQLGVKVNGKRQIKAAYSGQPHITKPQ